MVNIGLRGKNKDSRGYPALHGFLVRLGGLIILGGKEEG